MVFIVHTFIHCIKSIVKKVTDNGYVVEAAFKWTELDAKENALIGPVATVRDASLFDETSNGNGRY